jgi:hypothetical protein
MMNLGLFYDGFLQSLKVSQQLKLFRGWGHQPNPQPGGPGYPFLSGSSPLTYLAWEYLPAATLPPAKLSGSYDHCFKVGIPTGGFQIPTAPKPLRIGPMLV